VEKNRCILEFFFAVILLLFEVLSEKIEILMSRKKENANHHFERPFFDGRASGPSPSALTWQRTLVRLLADFLPVGARCLPVGCALVARCPLAAGARCLPVAR